MTIVTYCAIFLLVLMFLPEYIYRCKLKYLYNQGYTKIEKVIGYNDKIEVYFVKHNIVISEQTVIEMTLNEIKEKY